MTSIAANHPAVRSSRGRAATATSGRATNTHLSLVVVVAILNFVGLVMVLSSSAVQGIDDYGSSWGYFKRQLLWTALGVGALVVARRVDYRQWARLRGPLVVASAVLLLVVLVPGVGISVNGSRRWLGVGPFTFQPSELAKIALLVHVAHVLAVAHRRRAITDPHRSLLPVLAVAGLLCGLVVIEDLGTTLVVGAIVGSMLWVAGIPGRWMAGLTVASVVGTLVLGLSAGYRRARLVTFLDPWADPQNTGYQIVQSLVGLGAGGITGVGLGASRAKWGFLPNAHTDFIYAIIGEELGLFGSLFVLALFLVLGVLGVRTALHAPDRFGMFLATGVTAWILVQAFVNIGAVIGVLPVTGVPLPFVSFGGTALVTTMAATGILLNIAHQGRRHPAPGAPKRAPGRRQRLAPGEG